MAVPDLGRDLEWASQGRTRDEIGLPAPQRVHLGRGRLSDHEGVAVRVERGDVERSARDQPESASLAHRVGGQAAVWAYRGALPVRERARREGLRDPSAENAAIVVVGNEADLLALRLVGSLEAH